MFQKAATLEDIYKIYNVAQHELMPQHVEMQQAAKDNQKVAKWRLRFHIFNSAVFSPLSKQFPLLKTFCGFIAGNSKQTLAENNQTLEETASCNPCT